MIHLYYNIFTPSEVMSMIIRIFLVPWKEEEDTDYSKMLSDDFHQWLKNVGDFIPKRHQRRIIDDCCKKPCSLEVKRSYCPL